MDVTSHCGGSDITESGANQKLSQPEAILSQPAANGTLPHHSADEAPPLVPNKSEDSGEDPLLETSDVARLLPSQSCSGLRRPKGADSPSPGPICTPPSSSTSLPPPPPPPPSHSSTIKAQNCSLPHHHRHHQPGANQKRLSSTKSNASLKTDAAHIKEVAGDDCCVHCLLACLFCEMLSMCSALGDCLVCGMDGAACCEPAAGCCSCMEAAACTEDACQTMLDCGIMEDCCGSSDCLEICLECCSICFPT